MALVIGIPVAALAQSFPNRPIRIIVPFPPGSGSDHGARITGQGVSEILKQPVLVENRPSVNGVVGSDAVRRGVGDPYTMLLAASTHVANAYTYKTLPYDPIKDFTPIAKIGMVAFVLMVRTEYPVSNVKELVAYAKANPGKLNFGHGTAGMLAAATLFSKLADFRAVAVPYKGNPPALADLLGGQLDFSFVDMGNAIAQLKGGKLKALAVTMPKRSALAPEIPSFAEAGFPDVDVQAWIGFLTAAGIPREAQDRLSQATIAALQMPDVKSRLLAAGLEPDPIGSEGFAKIMQNDLGHWARILKDAGVQPE